MLNNAQGYNSQKKKKLPELMKVMKSAVGRQSVLVLVMRQILS